MIEDHSKQKLEDTPEGNGAKKLENVPENAKIKSLSQPNTSKLLLASIILLWLTKTVTQDNYLDPFL